MDFTFSAEQDALRDVVRSFLAKRVAVDVRAGHDRRRPRGSPTSGGPRWSSSGWTGLLVPEAYGGAGLGPRRRRRAPGGDGAPAASRARSSPRPSRATLPGPAGWARRICSHDLAAGRDHGRRWPSRRAAPATRWPASPRRRPRRAALDGLKPVVLDGHTADVALVVARDASGLAVYAVDDPAGRAGPRPRRDPQDGPPGARQAVPAARIGPPGDQTALIARAIDDMAVALCAETVGSCERALHAGHRVRQGAGAVRPAHRHLPGHQAQDRRHAPPARAGPGRARTTRRGRPTSTTPSASGRPPCARASSARRRRW